MTTTAMDVRRIFNVTQETRFHFNGWFRKRDRVVEHVMAHHADAIHRVTPQDVAEACRTTPRTGPPPDIVDIRDWRPEFAFTYVAHHVVETLGRLPGWDEFREFCEADDKTRSMLWTPAKEAIEDARADKSVARKAMHHKVVADFTAFLRDTFVLSVLREHGLDVRVHPLADVVFNVDAWVERLILNPRGGPQRSEALLVHAMPPFFFHDLALTESEHVGAVALPARRQIDQAARRLRAVLYPE
ncbi:hypothetical protein FHS29_004180 [Saccharothrix tamanrassetensis]|uniref:Uncharacterized protein n=1 Tax=Saccharothrix tamanrassetensis TaxID=1051531 RepID=A0A841CNM2_9PSEU|nr:hypothetical protein [Saccharothrix tamanrassetensis]MBB5957585.1 hypothetical protein [Saccharothrix tamanrassetensis]